MIRAMVLVGAVLVSSACQLTFAQTKAIPRMPDGKPNLNGIWQHPYVPDVSKDGKDQKGAGELPFTPAGGNKFKKNHGSKVYYTGHFLPFWLMRSMNGGGQPIQIVQYGDYLAGRLVQNTSFPLVSLGG